MIKYNKYDNYTKNELIEELETLKEKKYGLVWDKKNSQEYLDAFVNWENVPENFAPKQFPVLQEVAKYEIKTPGDKPVNFLIEGDNYHSLACLNFTHKNKIDLIYIDPPYNTLSKGFIYNDKIVDSEDPYKHSKWLSFMHKRLVLAQKLLKNIGIIYISIDNHELAQLKLLCDDIFDEKNFLTIQIWRGMHTVRNSSKDFNNNTEYILVYAKDKKKLIEAGNQETYLRIFRDKTASYPHDNKDGKGPYKLDPIYARNFYTPYIYTFENGIKWEAPKGNYPRYSQGTLKELDLSNQIVFSGKEPKAKRYLKDVQKGVPPSTLLPSEEVGFNKDGTSLLYEMFGEKVFDQPKPLSLIKYLLSIQNNKMSKDDFIVLDFFAGSGTTGHAVLEMNKEDGWNRRFILCTNNKDENNEHEIASSVCYPRIKKAIDGYINTKKQKIVGLGGNLKYFKTDFVEAQPTDKNKRELVNNSTEMICIKENIFKLLVEEDLNFRIYVKGNKYLGIIFNEDAIEAFKEEADKLEGQFIVYCFSYTGASPEKEFMDMKNKHRIEPIPEIILKVYREIFKR